MDFSLYKNQLLYSYRGFLSELYKQEYNLKHFDLILMDKSISQKSRDHYITQKRNFTITINDSMYYKRLFEKEIFRKKNWIKDLFIKQRKNFIFSYHNLDRIEIGSSTYYSFPEGRKMAINSIKLIKEFKSYEPFSSPVLFNLIPQKYSTILIVGTNKTKPNNETLSIINYLEKTTMEQKLKYVNDVLIKHVETWFISNNFYLKLKSTNKDKQILRYITKFFPMNMKRKELKFNMFR